MNFHRQLLPAAAEHARVERVGRPEHVPGRLRPGRRRGREVRAATALLGSRAAREGADDRPWRRRPGVPGLITDLVLSLDDHNLFLSNWLHGDLRHYDVSDPTRPQLRSQTWRGGLLGRDGGHPQADGPLGGGPQMLQCSLDGERVYVTNSLYSTWDNQFYPELRGWLTKLDRQADGSYALDPEFFVDFHGQTDGARPHEIHLPGGDCTTEIFQ